MNRTTPVRDFLRRWIAEHSKKTLTSPILDDTQLIEQGILTSVQVMDVILLIERLRKRRVDVSELNPGSFRDLNSILSTFFPGEPNE